MMQLAALLTAINACHGTQLSLGSAYAGGEQGAVAIIDETGKPLQAVVKRLGARIDEGSQTLLLIGGLPADAEGLLAGMSGTAHFQDAK